MTLATRIRARQNDGGPFRMHAGALGCRHVGGKIARPAP